jgi:L-glutamine---4-(methylsulfanyl)-2-oxobutanoate aminotransferase
VRPRPARLDRLPPQYFTALLARVAVAAQERGEPLVDLGRGNPEVGPPPHVIERLAEVAAEQRAHGYPPFRGLPELREAIAERYRTVYGVELDPQTEVAVVPGTKTALVELALVLAERGSRVLLPDPGYPDYPSAVALAAARLDSLALDPEDGWAPRWDEAARDDAVRFAAETGAAVVHDFAYGDLVFDGRRPESFLATEHAKDFGVEMFSMSKSYGMAGWRLGFVVGNPEIVERVDLLQDHARAGIFVAVQEAGIAALTGPQESVAARLGTYERRRDRMLEALAETSVPPPVCEGTFYVWIRLPDGVTLERLLEEHRVAVAPGEGFGPSGEGWARLSLAVTDEQLEQGLERLVRALS